MIPVKIKNADTALGKPSNWDASTKEDCGTLFIRRDKKGGLPIMLSAWKPSASELEILRDGGTLILGVLGTSHPPVTIYVSTED